MRTIQAAALTDAVAKLCIQANTHLPEDIVAALDATRQGEPWPLDREVTFIHAFSSPGERV